jgi:hypothetical protein
LFLCFCLFSTTICVGEARYSFKPVHKYMTDNINFVLFHFSVALKVCVCDNYMDIIVILSNVMNIHVHES